MMKDTGKARILTPKTVTAGEYTTVVYRYETGHPIDDSGYLKVVFRFAGDFGTPQFADPAAPNYCTVETDGDCRLEPRWDPKGHKRPWGLCLVLKVAGGYLDRGDKVTITFGDTSKKSPGWRMQTFCEKTFEFKTFVDPIATYQFKELERSPTLKIVPGIPIRTICIAPSEVKAGKGFDYWVKREDRWGNPVARPERKRHKGFRTAGRQVVKVRGLGHEGSVSSNPIEVREYPAAVGRYWADFHGQSEETVGTNSIKDYFLFARDYSKMDIVAHQGNDFQMTDDFWKYLNELTAELNKPGRFVTFPGYEWSANTSLGGDRNVWFSDEGGPIYRSSLELIPGKKSKWKVAPTADELFRLLRRQSYPRPFCAAHIGGRYADLRYHDEKLEHAVEVHSAWGTFEWIVEEAFDRGYRVGICANSDGHKGRPGASYPGAGKFGSLGGLTCVLAEGLDRESVQKAYEARHFYGTTGNRPLLSVQLCQGETPIAMMGDILKAEEDAYTLQVEVHGTGALERVEIWNGNHKIGERSGSTADAGTGKRYKVQWSGAEVRGRGRLVSWDGGLQLKGNRIASLEPINFLNPNHPLEQETQARLSWKSNTTGGHTGMILTLEKPGKGTLHMETLQKKLQYALNGNKTRARVWKCGGLKKQIEIRPLPNQPASPSLTFSHQVRKLENGDNPLFVKVIQEDGHMAWSSPIYLIQ